MTDWFRWKFNDDLSDIRRENYGYYKHYVHHFVTSFFTEEKLAGKTILDLGCGPGFYSAILASRGAVVTGIDKSRFLVQQANEHITRLALTDVEFIHGDFVSYSSRWAPGSFDYVIAIDTVVSFDHASQMHNHEKAAAVFRHIGRILKENGRFYIIEAHPVFGKLLWDIQLESGESLSILSSDYRIEYKQSYNPTHWFTLDEMTRATSESGLAISRIYEPDPSAALKQEDPARYAIRLKYPGMIVYDIVKSSTAVRPAKTGPAR